MRIPESCISNTNFSPTKIALANYAIEQTTLIENMHSYKIRKDLNLYNYNPHKIESVFC